MAKTKSRNFEGINSKSSENLESSEISIKKANLQESEILRDRENRESSVY